MKWLINFWTSGRPALMVGSRVRTSIGRGVVTSGCVSVRYDEGTKVPTAKGTKRHENDRTLTHNLDKIILED